MIFWIVCSWLNRWRYAFILWIERVFVRAEYRRDERAVYSRLRTKDYHGYAVARAWFWGKWEATE